MSSGLYTKFKEALMKGEIDLLNDTIKVSAIDTADYTVSLSAHQFFSTIAGAAVIASATLTGKSVTSGAFDADNGQLATVTGDEFEALVIWKDTGDPATSPLICYIDTATSGLPYTPTGGGIEIVWSDGSSKIFAI